MRVQPRVEDENSKLVSVELGSTTVNDLHINLTQLRIAGRGTPTCRNRLSLRS